jgi:hypothetical protein
MSVFKTGVVLGIVFGAWHLCWSILVALRWAQPVIDFVFWMHFIKPIYVIEPFDVVRAVILLIVTSGIGFVFGSLFALIWNGFLKT